MNHNMAPASDSTNVDPQRLQEVLGKYWGFDTFLPLQTEAIQSVLQGHDSVVVLPTGGGKSLCYQAPAMCLDGVAIVVSPLISLMKDQVDSLRDCGVPAAGLHSMMSIEEKQAVQRDLASGTLKLLYVSPERLVQERTVRMLEQSTVSLVAIDEAHCISAWGHDFRPEYRQLRLLKESLPGVGIHAYTATASEKVRGDIATQLALTDPVMLVGSFDRPNLTYRVHRRGDRLKQICQVIDRHRNESGIVYCITRKDVDATSAALGERGYAARPYHAGMPDDARRKNQDAFIEEQVDTIVATVAFGMGIDKSNVRYVIHAGMPKSIEHYQQESGRAGRDGLEAECHLLFSGRDYNIWKRMLDETEPPARDGALASLGAIYNFCTGVVCRHRAIVEYFGQQLAAESCNACDVCLGELNLADDPLTIGQKILSCVIRLRERFGGDYTAMVLAGSEDQRIVQQQHNELTTWGILAEENKRTIRDWIEQLVDQDFLEKTGDYNVLKVTAAGQELLQGQVTPRLLKPPRRTRTRPAFDADSWEGVDRELFGLLRDLRRRRAGELRVPAYVVFGDASLREMARQKPTTLDEFRHIKGVGDRKLEEYGEEFVDCIARYCSE